MKSPKAAFRILIVALSASAAICLLAIATGWYYVYQMSDQVSMLGSEIENMRDESGKLSELSIRYQKVLPQKSVVYGAIPTSKDESTFMADLEATAKSNGLAIKTSNIGNSQSKAAKTGEFSQTLNRQEYYELPIRYEVSGQYNNFTKFIAELSNLRRFNTVNDIAVSSDFSDKANVGQVRATFSVAIYAKR